MFELMPRDLTEYVEMQIVNDAIENRTQAIKICNRRGVASACIDEPFGSERHNLGHSWHRLYPDFFRVICVFIILPLMTRVEESTVRLVRGSARASACRRSRDRDRHQPSDKH